MSAGEEVRAACVGECAGPFEGYGGTAAGTPVAHADVNVAIP